MGGRQRGPLFRPWTLHFRPFQLEMEHNTALVCFSVVRTIIEGRLSLGQTLAQCISPVFYLSNKSAFCRLSVCNAHVCTESLNEGLSWKITKVSHLEGLFSLERNPGQWFVCTASQRPPAQTWWRVTSETRRQKAARRERVSARTPLQWINMTEITFEEPKWFFSHTHIHIQWHTEKTAFCKETCGVVWITNCVTLLFLDPGKKKQP